MWMVVRWPMPLPGARLGECRAAMSYSHFFYIDSNDGLESACQALSGHGQVALDTEFMRVDTFYAQVGLVQISDGQQTYLIDPLATDQWQPLIDLLTNTEVTKVLHACSEDLELLHHWLGVVPTPLVDTQVAAAYVGHGLSMGLQNMVATLLNIELEKGETRSDWLQRPLTDSQCHYAALDVALLLQCYDKLAMALAEQNKQAWFVEDMRQLQQPKADMLPQEAYQNVKNAWRFSGADLYRLQCLAKWREQQARSLNKPRNFIVKDPSLIDMVQRKPQQMQTLSQIQDMRPSSLRRYGKALLQQLQLAEEAISGADVSLPATLPQPLSKSEQKRYKRLQQCLTAVAEQHDVLPQLLGRKKELLALFERYRQQQPWQLPEAWQGWRSELIEQPMQQVFNQLGEAK